MEISEFIKQTVAGICKGIIEGSDEAKKLTNGNHPIAPAYIDGKKRWGDPVEKIEFDISTIVSEVKNKEGDIKASIKVLSLEAGGNGSLKNESKNESVSRIKFSVPFYPAACKNISEK